MSRYGVEEVLYRIRTDPARLQEFREDPAAALADAALTAAERAALGAGDVEALYRMGVHPFLLFELVRHGLFGLDVGSYLASVRRAVSAGGQVQG
jgi:Aromatic-ring-opening dioxygenase LigAB, LigA subunit